MSTLTAISPIDGRYLKYTQALQAYFSEQGLIRYRIYVEIEYLIAFLSIPNLGAFRLINADEISLLQGIYENLSESDYLRVKEIEQTTNHDVKAVEYFLREKLVDTSLSDCLEAIHFGLTSQDINNTALPLQMKHGTTHIIIPLLDTLIEALIQRADIWKEIPLLAHTHGQPASPTTLGKEIAVFIGRLQSQMRQLKAHEYSAKFSGATGNFNAHHVAFPHIDWFEFGHSLIAKLEIKYSFPTTQIEPYDTVAEWSHTLIRINTILINFSRDVWTYISMKYFSQKLKKNEVGSSAMPHKVNPIDFENAEGNLGIANALLDHFAMKLPISRLQRDLTDSTVLRNIGVPLGHMVIAYQSLLRGLEKIEIAPDILQKDLQENWAVVAEAIQTILRKEGVEHPYELLKQFSRGQELNQTSMLEFIESLPVSSEIKFQLQNITPMNYIGIAAELTEKTIKSAKTLIFMI